VVDQPVVDAAEMRLIARERAALRRVTTLAARGASSAQIFDAVAGEMGRIVAAENMIMLRIREDGTFVVVASWSARGEAWRVVPVGFTYPIRPDSISAEVMRTGRPARRTYTPALLAQLYHESPAARKQGVRSSAGCPIVVEGRLWGVLATFFAAAESECDGVEERMFDFLELVAAAIASTESRAELAASRARVVEAADASRRRIERDLHDGAQQRLVRLALTTRTAAGEVPPGQDELRTRLAEMTEELAGALQELRVISHGLHPTILSRGGLGPALSTLARRSAVPVKLDLSLGDRLTDSAEAAVYYVVSEALANAAKHAQASRVLIATHPDGGPDDRRLTVTVRDDGVGGARRGRGQGLIGLQDRVEALGGRFDISSPPGGGTTLTASIPIAGDGSSRPSRDD
jgi:signal transduction histidine kinase